MKKQFYLKILLGIIVMMVAFLGGTRHSGVFASDEGSPQSNDAIETEGNHVFNCMNAILEEDLESNSPSFSDFVANYGGGIIEGNHLTIFVKGGMDNQILFEEKMNEKGIDHDRYDIVTVEYSYSDLESQIASFWDFRNEQLEEGVAWAEEVYSVAICQERNCITVCTSINLDISSCPDLLNALENISHEIVVLEGEPQRIEETTLKPGMGIGTGGSVGFRCKLNGNKGIVTTVHTTNYSSLNPVSYGGTSFGSITAAAYGNSADFCFIQITNSNFTASRVTNTSPSYTLHSSNYVTALPTNYTVYMAGQNSSSVRQGSVVNYSGSVSGDSGTDWLICSYSSSNGDSGGCIFAVMNGDNCVVGIHDGSYGSNKYGTKLTRMKAIYSGLSIY